MPGRANARPGTPRAPAWPATTRPSAVTTILDWEEVRCALRVPFALDGRNQVEGHVFAVAEDQLAHGSGTESWLTRLPSQEMLVEPRLLHKNQKIMAAGSDLDLPIARERHLREA